MNRTWREGYGELRSRALQDVVGEVKKQELPGWDKS